MTYDDFKPVKKLAIAIVMANIESYMQDKRTYNHMLKNHELKKKAYETAPNPSIKASRHRDLKEYEASMARFKENVLDRWERWFLDDPGPLDSIDQGRLDRLKAKTGLEYPDAHRFQLPITELLQDTGIDNTHIWAKISKPNTRLDKLSYCKLLKINQEGAE